MLMDALDLKHAKSLLVFLSGMSPARKCDLSHIVKSHQVLDNLLAALTTDGFIHCESTMIGPKKYTISLTSKGSLAADHLKKLDELTA